MKNDSPLFPLERIGDSLFDLNRDGELTGFETVLRDSDILAEEEDAEKEEDSFTVAPVFGVGEDDDEEDIDDEEEDEDDDDDDEEDAELNALLRSSGKSLNKRKDVVEKLRLKLELISDKLSDIAWDLERQAEDLDYDSVRRSDMESFADKLNEAIDPLSEAISTLDDLNYMYF